MRRNPRQWASDTSNYVLAGIGIAVLLVVVGLATISYAKKETVTFTVTGKESVSKSDSEGNSGHEYRVYTSEGTFKVTDSIIYPRFDSADLYGSLREDVTYECEVYGWRNGFLSQFQNILECNEVGP